MATKLEMLAEAEGIDLDDMEQVGDIVLDSVVPGICMNPGCDYTAHYEPDQDRGWCEICGTNSVKSLAILMGVM